MAIVSTLSATTDTRHANKRGGSKHRFRLIRAGYRRKCHSRPRVSIVKRLVGTAIGLGVIAFLLCIPAFFYGKGTVTPTFEDTTITNYVADFESRTTATST